MKKIFSILCVVLFLSFSYALEFRPNSVREADLNVLIRAYGNYAGSIRNGDSMEIKVPTLQDDEMQRILWVEEKMLIGQDVIEPSYEENNGNKYAVFTIENLKKYGDVAEFEIVVETRLKINSIMGLGSDYDLSTPIGGKEEYLQESVYIEVNDRDLITKAADFSSSSLIESIREIAEWVNSNITYDIENYYFGTWGAKHTYESRRGVCDEFANLTAAFARIRGIPARYVTGISFDGERFGNHGWLEVYLPESGWIGLDSTYSEVGYLDAVHIATAKSTDANETVNLRVTTRSASPIDIQTTLHEPVVQINEIAFFEDLVDVELLIPERIESGEQFEINANLRNKQNSNIVIPIRIALHRDFSVEDEKRIIWLEPSEEREISWVVTAPKYINEGTYLIYSMLFLSPDNEIEAKLNVYPPGEGIEDETDGTIPDIKNNFSELEDILINNATSILIAVISIALLIAVLQFFIRR